MRWRREASVKAGRLVVVAVVLWLRQMGRVVLWVITNFDFLKLKDFNSF